MIALYTSKMCMMCVCDFEGFTQKHEILRYCFYMDKMAHSRGFEPLTSAFGGG